MTVHVIRLLSLGMVVTFLAGCASSHGPSAKTVKKSPTMNVVYVESVQDIPEPVFYFNSSEQPQTNPSRRYREQLKERDSISILITDTDPQSPFYRPGDSYQYGPVEIPSSGEIKIPYIGQIDVVGKTLANLSIEVTTGVQGVSSSADATVLRTERMEPQAGVIGEVNAPGSFPFDRDGFDAMDLLATAGGGKEHPDNYVYKLKRNGKAYCYDFATISSSPFMVEDGDVLSVEKDPAYSYYTMGNFSSPGRMQLKGPNTTLADAISDSGGFEAGKANPRGVFVFRDAAFCGEWNTEGKCPLPGTVFTAYVLDATRADFPFLIQQMRISERDVVFASQAPLARASQTARDLSPLIGAAVAAAVFAD